MTSDPVQQAGIGAAVAFTIVALIVIIGYLVSRMGRFRA